MINQVATLTSNSKHQRLGLPVFGWCSIGIHIEQTREIYSDMIKKENRYFNEEFKKIVMCPIVRFFEALLRSRKLLFFFHWRQRQEKSVPKHWNGILFFDKFRVDLTRPTKEYLCNKVDECGIARQ